MSRPANINKETLDKPWEILITIPLNIPHEFKLKIDIRERFRCNIEEKVMIFFKSKYLKHEREEMMIPIIATEILIDVPYLKVKKTELKINLNIPYILNFNNKPAKNNEIEVLDSQWTSGNQ